MLGRAIGNTAVAGITLRRNVAGTGAVVLLAQAGATVLELADGRRSSPQPFGGLAIGILGHGWLSSRDEAGIVVSHPAYLAGHGGAIGIEAEPTVAVQSYYRIALDPVALRVGGSQHWRQTSRSVETTLSAAFVAAF